MNVDNINSTNKLLKVMIAIMLRRDDQPMNLKQQIEILSDLGLKPAEIAEILGKSGKHINKELSGIRKNRKSK